MTRKLRVLHFIADLHLAGAERVFLDLVRTLDTSRFESTVCAMTGGPLADEARAGGIPVKIIERQRTFDLRGIKNIYALMRNERIDIVHSHMFAANLYGCLAAKAARIPVFIATEHGRYLPVTRKRLLITGVVARCASKMTAVSEELRQFLIKTSHIPPRRVSVIRNGIDTSRFIASGYEEARRELGFDAATLVVGTVANLYPVKGYVYLIRAAAELAPDFPQLRYVFIGRGPERDALEHECQEKDLSTKIAFLGQRRDVQRLLPGLDLFVLPSLSEGVPLTLLEAMAAERAAIATRVGGNTEVIEDGANGRLVAPAQPAALADAIRELVQDPERRRQMGAAARRHIEQHFSVTAMVRDYEQLYDELYRRIAA